MFHLGSSDAGMWVIIHSLQSHLQEGGLQAEQLGPTVILVCDADISSRALLNPLHHNSSTGWGLNTFFNYWSLQFSLDLGKNWKKFHNLFLSPQFMSVPYFKQFLWKIRSLALFFAILKRNLPPTIVLWWEMLIVISPKKFYYMHLFSASSRL